jgi:CheY-like chemotaxis protein
MSEENNEQKEETKSDETSSSNSNKKINEERYENLRIVVVDDSEFSRRSIVDILENEGFNIVGQASSAEEGVQLSTSTDANLFLIDVVMPERSGLELASILTENLSGIYIIMMSSLNLEQIVLESISSGAVDFLPKPFDPLDLIKAVEKIETEIEKDQ